jgi:hypothetical protein
MSDSLFPPDLKHDEQLAQELEGAAMKLQQAIHSAVEAGLKVTVELESMHHVGHHYPEPLVEIQVERVIKLT